MFIGRDKELELLRNEFRKDTKRTILVYGKRRVGKTTLIKESSRLFNGKIIFYEAIRAKRIINIDGLATEISFSFNEAKMSFSSYGQIFDYLAQKKEQILVLIDEYPDLAAFEKDSDVGSEFRRIINNLSNNIKLVISGSQMDMMKGLLEEGSPLFGRFDLILKLNEFDYKTASIQYGEKCTTRKKIEFYSIFGGLPYISSILNPAKTLKENIIELLIPDNGQIRLYLEYTLRQELAKAQYANSILATLGNSKKRYTEIENELGGDSSGRLAQQLDYLLNMEIIEKHAPINKPNDKKKSFYSISNNLVRFYYTYMARFNGSNAILSPDKYYERFIEDSIDTFISYRFESIARDYFKLESLSGNRNDILEIGTYWYNDKEYKSNGEFDCALRTEHGYEIYETKLYKRKMSEQDCDIEADKIKRIRDLNITGIGFISSSGFDFDSQKWKLITGNDLYS